MSAEDFRARFIAAGMARDVAMAAAVAAYSKEVAKLEAAFAKALLEAKAYEDQAK